jgi:hypothetical protein
METFETFELISSTTARAYQNVVISDSDFVEVIQGTCTFGPSRVRQPEYAPETRTREPEVDQWLRWNMIRPP